MTMVDNPLSHEALMASVTLMPSADPYVPQVTSPVSEET